VTLVAWYRNHDQSIGTQQPCLNVRAARISYECQTLISRAEVCDYSCSGSRTQRSFKASSEGAPIRLEHPPLRRVGEVAASQG
jgi:hypothetical protein